jgi:hypothetical protein
VTQGIDSAAVESALQQMRDVQLTREDVDKVLAELAERIGVASLALDENNVVSFTVDDEIEITLVHIPHLPGIVAASPVPDRPGERGDLLKRLLQANMSWELTHGGTFGMIPPGKELMLCRLIPLADKSVERLETELAGFAELAGSWQAQVEDFLDFLPEGDDEAAEPAPPPGGMA